MQITQKAHRLNELINLLENSNRDCKLSTLAKQLDCNEKTIRRYIQEIEYHRQAPYSIQNGWVRIDHEQRTQQSLINGYWLDNQTIQGLVHTYQLINNLPKELTQLAKKPLQKTLNTLQTTPLSKHSLKKHIQIIPSLPVSTNQQIFQQILDAILDKQQIHIHYWKRKDNSHSERTLSPQKIILYKDQWYLDAYCHLKQDLRTFNLIAITQITRQTKAAKKIAHKQLKQHYTTSYGIFAGKKTHTAIIHFNPTTARWIQHCQWHPDQSIQQQKDGSIHLHIPYHNATELIADILKWGENATVLAPEQLIEEIKHKIAQMHKNYKQTP